MSADFSQLESMEMKDSMRWQCFIGHLHYLKYYEKLHKNEEQAGPLQEDNSPPNSGSTEDAFAVVDNDFIVILKP